jgi:hypothetical protein
MGVIGIHGYNVDSKEPFHHALNVLNTTEGIVYIEPQLDELWWYDNHQEMYANHRWKIVEQDIFIESLEIMADY